AALARGCQFPMLLAPLRLYLPLTLRDPPALPALLDPALLVIVVRVIGAALPVELPIQPAQGFGIRSHLRTERLQECSLVRHHREGRGAQVQPHDPGAQWVLGPPERRACTRSQGSRSASKTSLLHSTRSPHQRIPLVWFCPPLYPVAGYL